MLKEILARNSTKMLDVISLGKERSLLMYHAVVAIIVKTL